MLSRGGKGGTASVMVGFDPWMPINQ